MPAENSLFPQRWCGRIVPTNLEVIWEMSDQGFKALVAWGCLERDWRGEILRSHVRGHGMVALISNTLACSGRSKPQ
jgi:hypothetical protein